MALAYLHPPIDIADKINKDNRFLRSSSSRDIDWCTIPEFFYLERDFHIIPEWAEAILTAGNILVIIFAFCGNIAALFVLWKARTSKKSTVLFLASLAVSDLILVATSPPIELGYIMDIYHSWIFGRFLCKAIPFIQSMAVIMNSFCLMAIAMERYFSVVCAFRLSVLTVEWQTRLPYISLLLMWIFSTGVTLPNVWSYETYSFWTFLDVNTRPRNETCKTYYFCSRKPDFDDYNLVFYITLGIVFCALLAGFLFCYMSIVCFVQSHAKGRKSHDIDNNNGESAKSVTNIRQRRTTYLVIGLISVFSICRIPVWVFTVVVNVKKIPQSVFTKCLLYSLHLLSNVNCVVQPFMYAIWNDSLRTGNKDTTINSQNSAIKNEQWSCCFAKGIAKLCKPVCLSCRCKNANVYDPNKHDETIRSNHSTQKYFLSSKNELPAISHLSSEYT